MKLVVGLGNPGRRYARTRHNVGFRVVEALAARAGLVFGAGERFGGRFASGRVPAWDDLELCLLLPGTWMNRSGDAVAEAVHALSADPAHDVCVVFDDADLPFGRLRLRARGSDGGHRGLADVLDALATRELPRLRFGIGRPETAMETRDFVLERFSEDEERALEAHLERAADALATFLREGVVAAMNRYNAGPADAPAS